jgi:UDP-N-acetylmuramoyl-L-alanyl-D-glutamate--2,6-diaminopimelate ligase
MVRPPLALDRVARHLRDAHLLRGTHGPLDVAVSGVSQDSRDVSPGQLFLAWQGVDHDAHDFVGAAVEAGAIAVVVERPIPGLDVPQLEVSDGRRAGAIAADLVMGSPWKSLFLAGITGTNGKTTTAVLTRHLLAHGGPSCAVGTLGLVGQSGDVVPGTEGLTTPGPVTFSRWLRDMVDEGAEFAALEASSHALAQYRLDGTRMDVGVFTNLTQDHLDYHRGFDEYLRAKGRLIDLLKPDGWTVVNADEGAWQGLPTPPDRTFRFGIEGGSGGLNPSTSATEPLAAVATDLELSGHGSAFTLHLGAESARVELPLPGGFNVENALAAAGAASVAGMEFSAIVERLGLAPQIPGRLEQVVAEPFTVLIDFAHTADALDRVLSALRPLVHGRLLVLFGAGGDRDRGKRPLMGEVAGRLSDLVFVTSDNPRTEDPDAIIDDIVAGMDGFRFVRFADRHEAIRAALSETRAGDLLLLAGKGHETYQVIGTEKVPFDERTVVRDFLAEGEGGSPA